MSTTKVRRCYYRNLLGIAYLIPEEEVAQFDRHQILLDEIFPFKSSKWDKCKKACLRLFGKYAVADMKDAILYAHIE